MLIPILTFILSFVFLLVLVSILFMLIRDFSSPRRRWRNTLILGSASLMYLFFMLALWGFTWVGTRPF